MIDHHPEALLISTRCQGLKTEISFYNYNERKIIKRDKINGVEFSGPVFLGDKYLALLDLRKCLMNVWDSSGLNFEVILPDPASCIASTNGGNYIIAGIRHEIYIWQTSSGILIARIKQHSSKIKKLMLFDNDLYFLSLSEDFSICVWNFNQIISEYREYDFNPSYLTRIVLTSPALDLECANKYGESSFEICVVEHNSTVAKIYNAKDGKLKTKILFNDEIESFVFDADEDTLVVLLKTPIFMKIKLDRNSYEILAEKNLICSSSILSKKDSISQLLKNHWENTILRSVDNIVEVWSNTNLKLVDVIQFDGLIYDVKYLSKDPSFTFLYRDSFYVGGNKQPVRPFSRLFLDIGGSKVLKEATLPIKTRTVKNNIVLPDYKSYEIEENRVIDGSDEKTKYLENLLSNYYRISHDLMLSDLFNTKNIE